VWWLDDPEALAPSMAVIHQSTEPVIVNGPNTAL
jgi:hypothetical protein